jgi:hypothetical protein
MIEKAEHIQSRLDGIRREARKHVANAIVSIASGTGRSGSAAAMYLVFEREGVDIYRAAVTEAAGFLRATNAGADALDGMAIGLAGDVLADRERRRGLDGVDRTYFGGHIERLRQAMGDVRQIIVSDFHLGLETGDGVPMLIDDDPEAIALVLRARPIFSISDEVRNGQLAWQLTFR